MAKQLFNDGWQFTKQKIGTSLSELTQKEIAWYEVEIPHDWLIYDTQNLYETGEGWYKKSFMIDKIEEQVARIYFEGVYMNSTVFINGEEVGVWRYGYSSFEFDVTKYLHVGENTILVRVQHEAPNTRWYSGAGIYRNVYLKITSPVYLVSDGVYIVTNGDKGDVSINNEINEKAGYKSSNLVLRHSILDETGIVVTTNNKNLTAESDEEVESDTVFTTTHCVNDQLHIDSPILWDLENCYLYTLKTELLCDGEVADEETTPFGFRTIEFDSNEGFSLNGVEMKIRGVCLHHDLGSLGSAMNKNALKRQLLIMKEMGVNAIRTSHNMPAVELMELCDQIGLLVDTEAFDMWEMPKTEFDNARFFRDTCEQDIASWVRRDRNHPSLMMWSIGNEIHDTHAGPRGLEIAKQLKSYVQMHDPKGNAVVTIGSNYIAWENAQKVAEELTYSGYNYGEYLYDQHHEKYPHWIIYGSETTSTVKSRGIYHFPAATPILTHDDIQCSSLGNSTVGWGAKNAEWAWTMDRDRKYCAGQFIWTGVDYIGEPTPYSTKNSYFGIVDTAGIPKDIYYMYQAEWTDYKKYPMVHLLPYWDFNIGQIIDVVAYSNAPKVELYFNGNSLGAQSIDHKHGTTLHGAWQLKYEPGTLTVKAYNEEGNVIAEDSQSSFGEAVKLSLIADKNVLKADGRDLCFVEVSTVDAEGHYVANARNRVHVEVTGAGRLIGLDNGDSTDYDDYKDTNRRLFSGKLMAVIESKLEAGPIEVNVSSKGLNSTELIINVDKNIDACKNMDACKNLDAMGISVNESNPYNATQKRNSTKEVIDEIPARKIELSVTLGVQHLNAEQRTATICASILPKHATYQDLIWKVVNNSGVESNIATLEINDRQVVLHAIGDGECRLRCMCKNGGVIPQIISEMEFNITGLGAAVRNPYQFNSASFFNLSNVPLNVVKDGAISGFHERTMIGFSGVDFGKTGTQNIKLYVGNSGGGPIPIEIWEGMPGESDAKCIEKVMFELNGQWDGFLPNEFNLPVRLTGMKTISFVIQDKITFGGFEFIKAVKAYEQISAAKFDQIYGDSYEIQGNQVEKIGNNVVLEFEEMDFSVQGFTKITIKGKTPIKNNTIHVRFSDENGNNVNQLIEFPNSVVYTECEFKLKTLTGEQKVSFVFLPGSNFDFDWFQFA